MRTTIAAAFLVALALSPPACKTAGLPPPVANVVGITVDCTKLTGQNLVQGEISKVTSALATANFDQAEADLRSVVGDLTAKGVLLDAAWGDVSCIVDKLVGEAFADARASDDQDQLAAQRRDNGQRWMREHKVTIVQHSSAIQSAASPLTVYESQGCPPGTHSDGIVYSTNPPMLDCYPGQTVIDGRVTVQIDGPPQSLTKAEARARGMTVCDLMLRPPSYVGDAKGPTFPEMCLNFEDPVDLVMTPAVFAAAREAIAFYSGL